MSQYSNKFKIGDKVSFDYDGLKSSGTLLRGWYPELGDDTSEYIPDNYGVGNRLIIVLLDNQDDLDIGWRDSITRKRCWNVELRCMQKTTTPRGNKRI